MELKLLCPFDSQYPEFDTEQVGKLRDQREFPNDREWAVYQAKIFYEVFGDVQKAVEILKEALQKNQQDADILACLGECYSRIMGSEELALDYCSKALAINNQLDYAYTIMARVQTRIGRPIDAYKSAMAALKINSLNFEAGVYLGAIGCAIALAENDEKEMELSIKNLRKTQRLNPSSQRLVKIIQENEEKLNQMKK
ncbi:MAG: hypothetical protein WCX17_04375 [Parcubacteria group bacterium]|jgi:tetratricopeptide (TPR) repeat protein